MTVIATPGPTLLHAIPGRVRIRLPDLTAATQAQIETRLRALWGVRSVQANPVTHSVVLYFDPVETDGPTLLEAIRAFEPANRTSPEGAAPARGRVIAPSPMYRERPVAARRTVRIPVRGLDRDPDLSRRVVEHLERRPGVRAQASPLTGRVLVEWDERLEDLRDLLCDIAEIELPDVPGEDIPDHPLDPAPLIQSASRTAASALGLGVLGARRLAGIRELPSGAEAAAHAAGVIGVVRGFPVTRNGLRDLLGRNLSDLLLQGAAIISLAFSGSILGLLVTGAESLRLLTEVLARRAAWQRYAARLTGAAAAEPGATIRLLAGQRTPRAATVVEGHGMAGGRDGLPITVDPGGTVPAGARLSGGPFVLQLQGDKPFTPQPRPSPPAPTFYDGYQHALTGASLAYAGVLCLVSGSPRRLLEGLLLVNPRPAVIGMEMAALGASARVLRAGATVLDTRRGHGIRRLDVLLLDSPRVLTEGVEPAGAVALEVGWDEAQVLTVAARVAVAAAVPWGGALRDAGAAPLPDGTFREGVAAAEVGDGRYTLGALAPGEAHAAAQPFRERGEHVLALRRAGEAAPVGLIALRPRLAHGVAELAQTCRREGVALQLLAGGARLTAEAVARRSGVALLADHRALDAIRSHQGDGLRVALVSDSTHAAEALAASDLAIGLSAGHSRFPAHVDLLAPDLIAVAAVVEAGARREAVTRDSVIFSVLANLFGAAWGFAGEPGVLQASRAVYVAALAAMADGWWRLSGGERFSPGPEAHRAATQPR